MIKVKAISFSSYCKYAVSKNNPLFIGKIWSIRGKPCYQLYLVCNKTADNELSMRDWS